MVLDWKKVALVMVVVGAFVVLALTKNLPENVITAGVTALLGYLGGLFTPVPGPKAPAEVLLTVTGDDRDDDPTLKRN